MYLCNRNKYLFPREMDFKGMCMLRLMSVFLTEYKSFFFLFIRCVSGWEGRRSIV